MQGNQAKVIPISGLRVSPVSDTFWDLADIVRLIDEACEKGRRLGRRLSRKPHLLTKLFTRFPCPHPLFPDTKPFDGSIFFPDPWQNPQFRRHIHMTAEKLSIRGSHFLDFSPPLWQWPLPGG